jgi:hypothetical protein
MYLCHYATEMNNATDYCGWHRPLLLDYIL